MCTQFHVIHDDFSSFVSRAQRTGLANDMMIYLCKPLTMSGDIHPTDIAAVLAPDRNGAVSVFPMLWGFSVPNSSAPVLNCRTETAATKEMWSESWKNRRCVIPASWYYEWEHFTASNGKKKTGQKYAIQPAGETRTWLAGLYRFEERGRVNVPVFSVLTREPGIAVKDIHDRMPLILPKDCVKDWLDRSKDPSVIAEKAITDVIPEKAG